MGNTPMQLRLFDAHYSNNVVALRTWSDEVDSSTKLSPALTMPARLFFFHPRRMDAFKSGSPERIWSVFMGQQAAFWIQTVGFNIIQWFFNCSQWSSM